ncbi:M1 family metallopeptidase [Adhaeribacter rhizoryzae]|uniref:M1 family metallopeptidase n=1 Tax=Adhaeribacter rhizoryzae TaxID=2607907 RepID=UPI0012325898|nr:M1 family metallopeptidase [Adhaeribacter rhizoryzae]
MKYLLVLLLSLLIIPKGFAQTYWQQEVNYTIAVSLNDEQHTLTATEEIEYINHSPHALTFIYFHLWPNAYKNNTTAFAKQQLVNKKRDFQFAPDSARGYIDGLDFKINGQTAKFEIDEKNIDIGKLILNQPLTSGQRIRISTPFRVKLPNSFSRLGHVGQSYQITQWFPKPAVYDHKGWHQMPYLDQGEFYAEFGRFDVSITLPANYLVAATGVLQNTAELRKLDSLSAITADKRIFRQTEDIFPSSSAKTKTLRYTATNIHDFAWFADKRFNVLKGEVELPHSKRKVTTWLFFLNKNASDWVKSLKDINEAVHYYSLWVGDCPYEQATAVDGALSAGVGMEYPMVTVTDPSAIIHEVGHNWFYGILGTNERQHPWLDEGINSYYEFRMGQLTNHNYSQLEPLLTRDRIKKYRLQNIHSTGLNLLLYQIAASRGLDQPIEEPAASYTYANYGSIVYMKTGVMLQYLANYLTHDRFDKAFQTYFRRWQFKHPYPKDLQAVFEEVTGEKLDWFFKDLIQSTQTVDAALTHLRQSQNTLQVSVENKTNLLAPVPVSTRNTNGQILEVKWTKPGQRTQELTFNSQAVHDVVIDPGYFLPELNRSNNRLAVNSILKKVEPIRLQFLAGVEQFDRKQIYFVPALGANTYDRIMLGGALYNSSLFQKKINYLFMPLYSVGQKELRGIGNINIRFLPKTLAQSVVVGLNAQRFERFQKLEPSVAINFPKPAAGASQQQLQLGYTAIAHKEALVNPEENGVLLPIYQNKVKYNIPWARYTYQKKNALQTVGAELHFDLLPTDTTTGTTLSGNNVLVGKLSLEYERYYSTKKRFGVRVFGGNFFGNASAIPPLFQLGMSSSLDYTKETIFLDRSQRNDNLAAFVRQTDGKDGAFRNFIPIFSSRWLTAVNLNADIPVVPLTAYLDLGTAYGAKELLYGTGLSVSLAKNFLQIYFPVAGSNYAQNIPESFENFKNNIRFQLQLNTLNPFRQVAEMVR